VFGVAKVEDLDGVRHEVLDEVPDPVRTIRQHDHFCRLWSVGVLIDLRDQRAKGGTVRDLGPEKLVEDFVALFAHCRYIGRREGDHRFRLTVPLILGTLARLARRT
jgi:hypothetical protein